LGVDSAVLRESKERVLLGMRGADGLTFRKANGRSRGDPFDSGVSGGHAARKGSLNGGSLS